MLLLLRQVFPLDPSPCPYSLSAHRVRGFYAGTQHRVRPQTVRFTPQHTGASIQGQQAPGEQRAYERGKLQGMTAAVGRRGMRHCLVWGGHVQCGGAAVWSYELAGLAWPCFRDHHVLHTAVLI